MVLPTGTITRVSVADDGWSAWVMLEGLGLAGSSVTYDLDTEAAAKIRFSVTDAGGAVREVIATRIVRKPFPEDGELDHNIVGDDLMVHVALSEFVFSTSQVAASIGDGWASTILAGQQASSRAAAQLQVVNFSEISAEDAGPVANFVTPDRQLVDAVIHVEVIVGSVFANFGDEVASVRFIARDQHGNEVSVRVDAPTLSTWGKGDARPVHSYGADIPTTGLTDGDRITVQAEITDHIGNVRVSAPNGSVPANPTAFTDQVYLLDTNGSFGKAFAYVDSAVATGSGVVSADPALAAMTPFPTIAAAMIATQVYHQQNFGRANLDNGEIRLKAGTHVWVDGALTAQQASTDDVWLTITRDPAATIADVRLTGAIDGRNTQGIADDIKIEGLTIDRAPMGSSLGTIFRGQSGDSLWLHDIVFEGGNQRTVSFQVPDIWVTQSDFNGTSRALTTFGTDINMFRIRGIEADAGAGNIINGHLLVGSDLHNLVVRYPVTPKTPNASGSVVAYNAISSSTSTLLLGLQGVQDVAVIGNVFNATAGPSSAVSISADGATTDISNIIFHNNTLLNERMNVGYNDVAGANHSKTLISLKWNDIFQLNTKHDVFSSDADNTGAWSVLYGVGFESNVIQTNHAGSRESFGFAYDGVGASGSGSTQPGLQQDVADLSSIANPPVAVADDFLMNEDSVLQVTAAQGVLANDYDVNGDRLTATLVTGPANGNLTLKADGSFIYTPLANFHGQVSFSYATGAGIHLSDPTTVVISVQGVNDSPFAIDDAGQAAFVGDTVRFTRNELLANDTDIDGDPLNLISVQDATDGSVQLVNGEIVFSVSARATTQASFSYTVSDNQGGFATAMVRIPLMARPNQAPEISSEATAQINENQTAVMTVTGTDPDADTTIVYGISGGADAALFTIDALTGALAFQSAPDFEAPADANGNNVYEVVILASDGALTSTQELAVTVTNVNDIRPVIGSNGGAANAVISIPENGTLVTTVTATDPDAQSGSTITYAITGGADAALFTIDSKTGVLRFETAPNFERPIDAGADNIYNLVVAASDKDLSTQQSITVNVTDLVEAPTKTFTGTALADAFAINDGEGWIISGLAGNDSLTGGDKADLLVGGKNSDILIGGGGDDVFSFAAGDGVDSYDGGSGFDQIIATTANAIIGISTITGIEAISSGGFANVSIIGTTAADTFDFSNTLLTGIVQIDPGSGNDTVIGSTGSDTIVLGSGNDVFRAGEGDDIFIARTGAGSDVIDGGAGFDTIKAAAANAAINVAALVSIEAISANGFTGISLVGSSLAEVLDFSGMTLTGITVIDAGSGNDSVIGSAGSDIISLGTGNDNFSGGDGDDVFLAKASAGLDTVNGGNGHDIIVAASANVSLTLAALSGIEEISANGFSGVKLVGTSVADIMNYAGMTLTGIESINGGSGNDTITGSQANDRIMGDGGRDIVTGGAGADTFVFATTADSGVGSTKADYITDFVSGSDKIDLIAIDADTSLPGDQAFAFIGSAAFTGLGQLRIGVDSEGNVALFGNTTGSLAADFQISFGNAPVLTPTDLHL